MTRNKRIKKGLQRAKKAATYADGGLAGLPMSKWASTFEQAADALDVGNSGRAAQLMRRLPREARRTAEWDAIADAVWRMEGAVLDFEEVQP